MPSSIAIAPDSCSTLFGEIMSQVQCRLKTVKPQIGIVLKVKIRYPHLAPPRNTHTPLCIYWLGSIAMTNRFEFAHKFYCRHENVVSANIVCESYRCYCFSDAHRKSHAINRQNMFSMVFFALIVNNCRERIAYKSQFMIRAALNWKIRFVGFVCSDHKNMRKKTYGITYAPWQRWRKSWTNKWNWAPLEHTFASGYDVFDSIFGKGGKLFSWNKKFPSRAESSQAIPSTKLREKRMEQYSVHSLCSTREASDAHVFVGKINLNNFC